MQAPTTARRWTVREWILSAVVVATCIRVWSWPDGQLLPHAQAQVPDSGLQRKQILAAAQRTNELLIRIIDILGSETIEVRIVEADKTDKSGGAHSKGSRRIR